MSNQALEKLKVIGGVAGAIASILGLIFLLFPRFKPTVITNRAVELTDIRVRPVADAPGLPTSDGCHSLVAVSFNVRIEGYQNMPLHLYEKIDPSAATSVITDGIPCPPPLGVWDGWRQAKDLTTSVQSQLLPVEIQVGLPLKKNNWKIQLKIAGPKDEVLRTAETPPFNTR